MIKNLQSFLHDLENGEVDNLVMAHVNPVYSLGGFESMKKAGFTLYMGTALNETAEACQLLCPDHHYLEAWGDAEPVKGSYSLQQPCIHPLFNTRSFQDSLLGLGRSAQGLYGPGEISGGRIQLQPLPRKEQKIGGIKTLQAGYSCDRKTVYYPASESYTAPRCDNQSTPVRSEPDLYSNVATQ